MNTKTNNNNKKFTSLYFNKELSGAMETMTDSEMQDLLKELTDTKYWVAISKYVQSRLMIANGSLATLDPFKDPTNTARAQGIMSGLTDLQSMTDAIKESIKNAEKKAQAKVEVSEGVPPQEEDDPMY